MRIGVASVMQETNTFSVRPCRWEDFTTAVGSEAARRLHGTNSEFAGALAALSGLGVEAVPVFYAWAMPSGRLEGETFQRLAGELARTVAGARPLDGLVLSLHGAMATDDFDDADLELIQSCRQILGSTPIAVCLDLHANVTGGMVRAADLLIGYRTDPHVDMAATGERIASLLVALVQGTVTPTVAMEKRAMIVPAEAMNTTTGVLAEIRRAADSLDLVDISLFPVQPWLDVSEHGFGVVATSDGDPLLALAAVKYLAGEVWDQRDRFVVPRLVTPPEAYALARKSTVRPFLAAESADAPTAGAAGDSPAMVAAALTFGKGLKTLVTLVDPPAVAKCHVAGTGADVATHLGGALDPRFWRPVSLEGIVERVGAGAFRLEGVGYHGLETSMGRWAVINSPTVTVLVTERPAMSSDPSCFRHAGVDPLDTDVLVVKSCSDFRPNYPRSAREAVTLDVPGAATPRLDLLEFKNGHRWTPTFPGS